MRPTGLLAVLCFCGMPNAVRAQGEAPLPPPLRTPQLVVRHDGPHAPVMALAFAPDGTLYVGGLGKLVHRYTPRGGQYVPGEPIRVPLGPGNAGAVNAVAVSPDGKWVAVAGRAPIRGEVWAESDDGIEVMTPSLPGPLKRDLGVVYLFNPAAPQAGKVIRGPEAGVRALAFASPQPASGPVLVTAGVEWETNDKSFGAVRVYDVTTGKEQARKNLPKTPTRPGLAAWANGQAVWVGVAWPNADNTPGKLLVWDTAANKDHPFESGEGNLALALRTGKGGVKELVSGGYTAGGHLTVRPADLSANGVQNRLGIAGQFLLPLAVAPVGNDTAVVVRDLPPPGVARPASTELRLIRADGGTVQVQLTGADTAAVPTLAASSDGKWIAVGGFTDNRIELYDSTGRKVQTLAGAPGGFARVAFLDGDRLWVGGAADPAAPRGLVFDPGTRKVTAGPNNSPADTAISWTPQIAKDATTKDETVTLTTAVTGRVAFTLLRNERPTAVAYLPAAPAWDKKLGALLAVAHYSEQAAVSLVTVFDAATGRRVYRLSGPSLRIESLAFSGTRPLLAAVGADRVVSVWALKNLSTPYSAVEGLVLAERGAELAVAAVEPGSPASKVFKADAVIEAVGRGQEEPKAVKTYREFLLAVRAVEVGGAVRVRLKGNPAAVAVPVGRGVGHRHPLFTLWVNPAANADGTRDWIGWSPAGPYDANAVAAEARLGWLSATGNPAEPVVYAGADQYRRTYYKRDFLRYLAEDGDFHEAFKRHAAANPVTKPTLTVHIAGAEPAVRRVVTRTAPSELDIRLSDPDRLLILDTAILRWRVIDQDGKPGRWQEVPFADGTAKPALAGHAWTRGLHKFEVALHETADGAAVAEATATVQFAPPEPVVAAVRLNGAAVVAGAEPTSEKETVEVSADVTAADGEEVTVTVTTSGPSGETATNLPAGKGGKYGPVSVKLRAEAKTMIRVNAVNAGARDDERLESAPPVDVTVRHVPRPKPLPTVRLSLTSPADRPAKPGAPFVTETPKVRLSAAITAEKVEKLEWDDGDGVWVAAEFKPTDPKAPVVTRDVQISEGGKPRTLRVRVTAPGGARTEEVAVVWAGLPAVDFTDLPTVTKSRELSAVGMIRAPKGAAKFDLRIVMTPADGSEKPRIVQVPPAQADRWEALVRLSPGDNRVGLVVSNPWKEKRLPERDVRYIRPPQITRVTPIITSAGGVGDVSATVLSPLDLPPRRLIVAGQPIAVEPTHPPVTLFGMTVWRVKADAVTVAANGVLPKSVRVAAENADGDGEAVEVAVSLKPAPPPPPPPQIIVVGGADQTLYTSGASIKTDLPRLPLGVRVLSAAKLTRVELRRTDPAPGQPDGVPGFDAATAVAVPGGFELSAKPELLLREGVNPFEVVVTTAHGRVTFPFSVSYTPPPVRVVLDTIEEIGEGGKTVATTSLTGGDPVQLTRGAARVRGRVIWSGGSETARGVAHEIVLVANEVRHLPVGLSAPGGSSREAAFVAPLFLNAAESRVRVEIRTRARAAEVPQQKVAEADRVVRTKQPISQQRLHVLVIAPLVGEDGRVELARKVVAAVDGVLPTDRPVLHRMTFKHGQFSRAYLYAPLVQNVSKPAIVGLLYDVEDEIRRSTTGTGADGWVNDVVVVYYQGRDLTGKDGAHRLHTSRSIVYPDRAGERFAVRLDELPQTPGVRLQMLNVSDTDRQPDQQDALTATPLLLRYVWKDAEATDDLLPAFREAVTLKATIGGAVDLVSAQVLKSNKLAYSPTVTLPPPVRERSFGGGGR